PPPSRSVTGGTTTPPGGKSLPRWRSPSAAGSVLGCCVMWESSPHERSGARALAVVLLALLAGGAVATVVAAAQYPGGTWMDRSTPGHSFWGNFLCDIARDPALDGRPHPGAPWGRAAEWGRGRGWGAVTGPGPLLLGRPGAGRAPPAPMDHPAAGCRGDAGADAGARHLGRAARGGADRGRGPRIHRHGAGASRAASAAGALA